MKLKIFIVPVIFVILGCSQKPNFLNKNEMTAQFVSNTPDPKIYKSQPEYQLSYYSSNCRWEIRLKMTCSFLWEKCLIQKMGV